MARRIQIPRIFRRMPTQDLARAITLAESRSGGSVQGKDALVISTRVGQADHVPPGYRLGDCSECGSPVWLNPEVVDACEGKGMTVVPLCFACLASGQRSDVAGPAR